MDCIHEDGAGEVAIEAFDEVLTAAQAGHELAIAELYRDLQPRLLRYLQAQERGAAEDIASETWLQAARDLRRFDGDESAFSAWMFTIARNRLRDWRRHTMRRPAVPTAVEDLPESSTAHDAATLALARIDTDAALSLIATLPAEQADVVLLRVVGGLSTERVATMLGRRPGAVRVIQHRALRRLAAQLAEGNTEHRRDGVTR